MMGHMGGSSGVHLFSDDGSGQLLSLTRGGVCVCVRSNFSLTNDVKQILRIFIHLSYTVVHNT